MGVVGWLVLRILGISGRSMDGTDEARRCMTGRGGDSCTSVTVSFSSSDDDDSSEYSSSDDVGIQTLKPLLD